MDIFSIVSIIGGLAFFLFGMNEMSSGLKKISGGKLEKTLEKMTSTPMKGLLLGAVVTIAIQSSSAMTVMLVGLVNSGLMELSQTLSVIMGSNIGTTLTAWILSLSGISSDNIFISFLKPENFAPLFAIVGIGLIMMSKRLRRRDIGSVLIGFAILMSGMTLMSSAVSPLADMPEFQHILTAFNNPFLGLLVGIVFTGIIQSSAASIGILQALSLSGGVTYGMAIPIVLGQNIGTCVTALLSSMGVNKNAKRVAVLHVTIKIIGAAICLSVFYILHGIIGFSFVDQKTGPVGIAVIHSIFNLLNTVLLMPFSKQLLKLSMKLVPDREEEQEYTLIDERLLNTPSFAVFECNEQTLKMARHAHECVDMSMGLLDHYSDSVASELEKKEDLIDNYEDKLGTYLVKLSSKALSDDDSRRISRMLHVIGNLERLGDHAMNLLKTAREISDKKIVFSQEAYRELDVIRKALDEIMDMAFGALENDDVELAKKVEPLEQVIDDLTETIKFKHIERLQNGVCTIELGFVLADMLSNFERVSDHCSNIAVAIIETNNNSFKTHEYLSGVKNNNDRDFNAEFEKFKEKYAL